MAGPRGADRKKARASGLPPGTDLCPGARRGRPGIGPSQLLHLRGGCPQQLDHWDAHLIKPTRRIRGSLAEPTDKVVVGHNQV